MIGLGRGGAGAYGAGGGAYGAGGGAYGAGGGAYGAGGGAYGAGGGAYGSGYGSGAYGADGGSLSAGGGPCGGAGGGGPFGDGFGGSGLGGGFGGVRHDVVGRIWSLMEKCFVFGFVSHSHWYLWVNQAHCSYISTHAHTHNGFHLSDGVALLKYKWLIRSM